MGADMTGQAHGARGVAEIEADLVRARALCQLEKTEADEASRRFNEAYMAELALKRELHAARTTQPPTPSDAPTCP